MKRHYSLCVIIMFTLSILFGCDGKAQEPINKHVELNESGETIKIVIPFFTARVNEGASEQWKKSDSLYAHASIEELYKLSSTSKEPAHKLIAFRALLMKDPHEAANLVISEIDDTTLVSLSDGICGEEDRVSNVRLVMIQYGRNTYHVTREDSIRIDSAVLYSNNSALYEYSHDLYERIPSNPKFENRLRQLYTKDIWALVALAKLHKTNDKKEIMHLLSQVKTKNKDELFVYRDTLWVALYAVAEYPDNSFIPQIQMVCKKSFVNGVFQPGRIEPLFRALIAYNAQWSYRMIDKILSEGLERKSHSLEFYWAYRNNPLPRYKPLVQKYYTED